MSDACTVIIDRLIEERRRRNMTQRQLAEAAGLAQPAVARMESKKATPQLDTLLQIAAALDCSLEIIPHK